MPPAPLPANEEARVAALVDYGILDTPREDTFDSLARRAAEAMQAPVALISLVDSRRQWFKARVGLDLREMPRSLSFCAYTLLDGRTLVVGDTRLDRRFADNPLVTEEPGIRFYAGAPLVDAAGHRLGALCVLDRQPRAVDARQVASLEWLADAVTMHISARWQVGKFVEALRP